MPYGTHPDNQLFNVFDISTEYHRLYDEGIKNGLGHLRSMTHARDDLIGSLLKIIGRCEDQKTDENRANALQQKEQNGTCT